ncbi:MAG TPA: SAM-dependent methyltransferase [Rugosimonospora sp.]
MSSFGWVPSDTDVNRPNIARIHDYHLGGSHHFPADRWVAAQAVDESPDLPALARANRDFLQRAVRFLSAAGVHQFLDFGSGLPTAGNVHEVAQQADPRARVVYVDVDPVTVAHGRALLAGIDTAEIVRADLRDVRRVLTAPALRHLIDFTQPVGVVMVSVLHLLPFSDNPTGIVARYHDALPAGSYLALSYPSAEGPKTASDSPAKDAGTPLNRPNSRTRKEVADMLVGWQLVAPGLVSPEQWQPDGPEPITTNPAQHRYLAAVACKR